MEMCDKSDPTTEQDVTFIERLHLFATFCKNPIGDGYMTVSESDFRRLVSLGEHSEEDGEGDDEQA